MERLSTREMIERLVEVPSVSSVSDELDVGNREVVDVLAGWLSDEGWAVDVRPLPNDPRNANLVAQRGQGPGGLILSGHLDTVPFDEGRWRCDPFKLSERNGRWYGLGVTDMKGFFALAVEASRRFEDRHLKEPLFLVATADEECGMDGARRLSEEGLPARRALIGEPTGLRPVRMQKGVAMEALDLFGRSGHSSDPSYGESALLGMHEAMDAMLEVFGQLGTTHAYEGLSPAGPTLNFGRIEGGDNPNRICAHCRLEYDVRLPPGLTIEAVRRRLSSAIEVRLSGRALRVAHSELFPAIPAFATAPDSDWVSLVERVSGHASSGVSFATEAPFFAKMGADTVVLGPGDIEVAHQPDEFLELSRLLPTVDLLESLIFETCVVQSSC